MFDLIFILALLSIFISNMTIRFLIKVVLIMKCHRIIDGNG